MNKAEDAGNSQFNTKQQGFLNFVLSHCVSVGVEELDQEKLTPLLRLKSHNSIANAVADLEKPQEIGRAGVWPSFCDRALHHFTTSYQLTVCTGWFAALPEPTLSNL